jgi:type VI protein secretion system component Hcp
MRKYLLKLPGIAGTAKQSGHEVEIELTGLSFPVDGSKVTGGSSGAGQLTVEKKLDAASSALFLAFVNNTSFAEAVVTRLTLSNQEWERYRFKQLVFRQLQTYAPSQVGERASGRYHADAPDVERLVFDFASVDVKR